MQKPLTKRQEVFCLKFFELKNATEAAILAGYSPKTARITASENLTKPNVKARIAELEALAGQTAGDTIASVIERKQILTEIARGRFVDFMTNLTAEKLKSAALQEIRITETENGKATTIKLHNPIQAIAELNKMERLYSEGMTVNIDNRRLEITVSSEKTRELLEEIEEGKLPSGNTDN